MNTPISPCAYYRGFAISRGLVGDWFVRRGGSRTQLWCVRSLDAAVKYIDTLLAQRDLFVAC